MTLNANQHLFEDRVCNPCNTYFCQYGELRRSSGRPQILMAMFKTQHLYKVQQTQQLLELSLDEKKRTVVTKYIAGTF